MIIAWVSEDAFLKVNAIQFVVIVYLAIAISSLRERVAKLEGRFDTESK